MSTYVMSDIHGCYNEFVNMLAKINFTKDDRLIIAGDYIDRGPQSYEMLKWIENPPANVILLRGNHDEEFAYCIDLMKIMFDQQRLPYHSHGATKLVYEVLYGEAPFDYYGTIRKLIDENSVTMEQLLTWSQCIRNMPYVFREQIAGRTCIIVHAGYLDPLEGVETEDYFDTIEDFYLYARDDAYIYGGVANGMIIAGHTPTIFEEEFPFNDGKVYRMHDEELDCIFFDIDCGCAYKPKYEKAKLACLRIEDENVFYESKM